MKRIYDIITSVIAGGVAGTMTAYMVALQFPQSKEAPGIAALLGGVAAGHFVSRMLKVADRILGEDVPGVLPSPRAIAVGTGRNEERTPAEDAAIDARLDELKRLYAQGAMSDSEYSKARNRALGI